MSDEIINWLAKLFTAFRNLIGWYDARDIWICEIADDCSYNSSQLDLLALHEISDTFNLNWDSIGHVVTAPMEAVRLIGRSGKWNNPLFNALFHNPDRGPIYKELSEKNAILLPSALLDKIYEFDGTLTLYKREYEGVPTACTFHLFSLGHEEDAKIDFQVEVERS